VPVPLQAPPQPPKLEPLAGVALSVTNVPGATLDWLALQVLPQAKPAMALVTLPLPLLCLVTETVMLTTLTSNCALTLILRIANYWKY
jgi:hypothetical protein